MPILGENRFLNEKQRKERRKKTRKQHNKKNKKTKQIKTDKEGLGPPHLTRKPSKTKKRKGITKGKKQEKPKILLKNKLFSYQSKFSFFEVSVQNFLF